MRLTIVELRCLKFLFMLPDRKVFQNRAADEFAQQGQSSWINRRNQEKN
jgi:hypothetical protein